MIVRESPNVDVIMAGSWMIFSWTGVDHGRHHAWGVGSLISGQNTHTNLSVDAIKVGPWMIFAWTGLDHARPHAWKLEGGNL